MSCEPFICIKGPRAGEIHTLLKDGYKELWRPYLDGQTVRLAYCKNIDKGCVWQPYADFEREKLKELEARISIHPHSGYASTPRRTMYYSEGMIGYSTKDFLADSESSRLLKRAEFLREVCKREGVSWLPKEECHCINGTLSHKDFENCPCSCHKTEEKCEHNVVRSPGEQCVKCKVFTKLPDARMSSNFMLSDEYKPIAEKSREPTDSAIRCFLHKDDKDQLDRIEQKLDRLLSLFPDALSNHAHLRIHLHLRQDP